MNFEVYKAINTVLKVLRGVEMLSVAFLIYFSIKLMNTQEGIYAFFTVINILFLVRMYLGIKKLEVIEVEIKDFISKTLIPAIQQRKSSKLFLPDYKSYNKLIHNVIRYVIKEIEQNEELNTMNIVLETENQALKPHIKLMPKIN